MLFLKKFKTRGQSLIGIIIVASLAFLTAGGLHYYLLKQIPKMPEFAKKPIEKEAPKIKEKQLEKDLLSEKAAKEKPGNEKERTKKISSAFLAMKECEGIEKAETQEKIVALTFDDGPNGKFTEEILTILEKYDIKATFFVIGERALKQPELIKKIFQKGHIIGNHSYSHPRLPELSPSEVEKELKTTSEVIFKIIGKYPILFRPPYGACNINVTKQIKGLGYKIITWSSMTNDWSFGITSEKIAEDILRQVRPGGIIGLHDGAYRAANKNRFPLIEALPKIIESLKTEGYRFLTIPELLNVEPYLLNYPYIVNKILPWGHHLPLKPRLIDTIVIHSSYDALGDNPYSVDGVIQLYKIYGVSPHYLIARDGTIYRLAPNENIAYHAGQSSMPDGRTNVNDFSIGIELIYTKTESPNEIQYQSLVQLVKYLQQKYNIPNKNILGHKDIAPERKTDPWNFDWKKFNEMLEKFNKENSENT